MKFNKLYFVRQSKEEEVTNFIDCFQFRKDCSGHMQLKPHKSFTML
jgi:hypothetical protein